VKLKFSILDLRLPIAKRQQDNSIRFQNQKSKIENAFTLIEIMLAVVIFFGALAMIYSTWLMIMRATVTGQKAAAQAQRERVAIHTIEESITSIESFQASLQYYSFVVQNSGNGQQATLSFVARLPDDFPRSGRYGVFNVRRLTFDVEAVTDPVTRQTENDLVLRQYPILTGEDVDDAQNPFILSRNVQLFTVECWDTNSANWVDEWDNTNAIPPAIRVDLALGGKNDNSQNAEPIFSVTRDIAVPTQMMPVSAQVPGANPAMFQNGGQDMNGGGTSVGTIGNRGSGQQSGGNGGANVPPGVNLPRPGGGAF
jgi:type II secretory pathway pseudopilin PulG